MVVMPHMCQKYQQKGMNTHLVYHGFDTTLLEKQKIIKVLKMIDIYLLFLEHQVLVIRTSSFGVIGFWWNLCSAVI